MKLQETRRDKDDHKTSLLARGEAEPVRVTIQKQGEATRLWVRVGTTGDEQYSRTVYERIAARL